MMLAEAAKAAMHAAHAKAALAAGRIPFGQPRFDID